MRIGIDVTRERQPVVPGQGLILERHEDAEPGVFPDLDVHRIRERQVVRAPGLGPGIVALHPPVHEQLLELGALRIEARPAGRTVARVQLAARWSHSPRSAS